MDRFSREFQKMQREGADPSRVSPTRRFFGVYTERRVPASLSFLAGLGAAALILLGAAILFDLRPARSSDIRLASIVRSAISDPDSLAVNDIVARLAMPTVVAHNVVAIIDTPLTSSMNWLSSLTGRPPLNVEPGRIEALADVLKRLGHQSISDRARRLDRLMELDRLIEDPEAEYIVTAVGNLLPEQRHALVASVTFRRVLEAIAALPERKRNNLLVAGLEAVPEDNMRAHLMTALPTLDTVTTRLLARWLDADAGQRAALTFILAKLDNRDENFGKLLSGYYLRIPALLRIIGALPLTCTFASVKVCN